MVAAGRISPPVVLPDGTYHADGDPISRLVQTLFDRPHFANGSNAATAILYPELRGRGYDWG